MKGHLLRYKSDCEAKSQVVEVDSSHPGSEISFLQYSSFNDSREIEFFISAECSQRLGPYFVHLIVYINKSSFFSFSFFSKIVDR